MSNTISYRDLKNWYLENEDAKANAKQYFGDSQPSVYQTGFYSSPSWNWGYTIGIVGVEVTGHDTLYFEVVTQFGSVKAARRIYMPVVKA